MKTKKKKLNFLGWFKPNDPGYFCESSIWNINIQAQSSIRSHRPPLHLPTSNLYTLAHFVVSHETDATFFRIDLSHLVIELWAFEDFDFIKAFRT